MTIPTKNEMNIAYQFSRVTLLATAFALSSQPANATTTVPDERDRQVLEATLLHLLSDSGYNMAKKIFRKGNVIVLGARTPEKTGLLTSVQIQSDIGEHTLPSGTEVDLRRRNTPALAEADSYEAAPAFYTNLIFDPRIVVADLSDKTKGRGSTEAFEKAHPKARAYVRAYLPGYSSNGTSAVVRAAIGPSEHGALVTVVLEKRGEKWVVIWHHLARYL